MPFDEIRVEMRLDELYERGARLSYDFFDDRAQVALWARNLTNTEYFTRVQNLAQFFGFISRYYQAPRTFGAEISFRFGRNHRETL